MPKTNRSWLVLSVDWKKNLEEFQMEVTIEMFLIMFVHVLAFVFTKQTICMCRWNSLQH